MNFYYYQVMVLQNKTKQNMIQSMVELEPAQVRGPCDQESIFSFKLMSSCLLNWTKLETVGPL